MKRFPTVLILAVALGLEVELIFVGFRTGLEHVADILSLHGPAQHLRRHQHGCDIIDRRRAGAAMRADGRAIIAAKALARTRAGPVRCAAVRLEHVGLDAIAFLPLGADDDLVLVQARRSGSAFFDPGRCGRFGRRGDSVGRLGREKCHGQD